MANTKQGNMMSDVNAVLDKCWICLNQYNPKICPLYRKVLLLANIIKSEQRVASIAKECQEAGNLRLPETDEERLKVL